MTGEKSNEPVDARTRLAVAQWPDDAPRRTVTSFCAEHRIGCKMFYAIHAPAKQEGQGAVLDDDHNGLRRHRLSSPKSSNAKYLRSVLR